MDTPYKTQILIDDIKEYLEEEGPFETEDAAREFVCNEVDTALIYTSNVREFAQEYNAMPEDRELISKFIDDLMTDIFCAIDTDNYVERED